MEKQQTQQELQATDPNALIDGLIEKMNLKNDAALCRVMGIAPPVVSKLRHRKLPIGSSFLITAHEISGMTIRDLKALAKLPARNRVMVGS